MPIRLTTYRKGNSIPVLPGYTIFNSTELFRVYELTRGYEPILIVAYLEERPVAKLLAVIRKSVRLSHLPSSSVVKYMAMENILMKLRIGKSSSAIY